MARLGGKMLGLYVSENLRNLSLLNAIMVAPLAGHPCAKHWRSSGYDVLVNENANEGQSTSVSPLGVDGLCICLADMPFVSAAHIEQLIANYDSHKGTKIIASSDGKNTMPPAVFPASQFDILINLDGDKGARSLLSDAVTITFEKSNMLDIDTLDDLIAAEGLL